MTRTPELREGDSVLVRGHVRGKFHHMVYFTDNVIAPDPELLDIVCIEPKQFKPGDRVIAEGHHGTVLCVWPDGELLWVKPDTGNGKPWTVNVSDCRREPPPESTTQHARAIISESTDNEAGIQAAPLKATCTARG